MTDLKAQIAERIAKRIEQRHGTTVGYDAADIIKEEIEQSLPEEVTVKKLETEIVRFRASNQRGHSLQQSLIILSELHPMGIRIMPEKGE